MNQDMMSDDRIIYIGQQQILERSCNDACPEACQNFMQHTTRVF